MRGGSLALRLAQLGLPKRYHPDDSYWQADHIVPVMLGGNVLGRTNLRTLCTWCHRDETGRLTREGTAFRARHAAPR